MRTTIAEKAGISGVGLHKGRPSSVVFLPAAGPTGIRFFRPDGTSPVAASLENIAATVRGTNLSAGGRTLYTVEHILSACAGLGVDDLDIAMDGEEPPAADGSALPFAKTLLSAGLKEKPGQERSSLLLAGPLEFCFEKAVYRARPADAPGFAMSFNNPHPLIGAQRFSAELSPGTYLREIAPARTFGFKSEIDQLRAAGLALGGSLENAVIISEDGFLSAEGSLRFPDELARHKLLDLIGDLALTGLALDKVAVEAEHTGHKSNVNFAKLLMEEHRKRTALL